MIAGRLDLDQPALGRFDRTLAVDGVAESVHHAAEESLADRHIDDGGGALDEVAFVDVAVLAEDHHATLSAFEVERHARVPSANSTISPACTRSRP